MSKHGLKKRRSPEKNARTAERNRARKQWRRDHPAYAGNQLKCWPLPVLTRPAPLAVA